MTFMYVSARAVGDDDYRTRFLDPLIDDLRLTLVARSRYRAAVAAPSVRTAAAIVAHNVCRAEYARGAPVVPASRVCRWC